MNFNLNKFNNSWYNPGSKIKIFCWMIVSSVFFENFFPWTNKVKKILLVRFGAKIGNRVVIKPHVQIKYPWFLTIDDHSWIGEHVWIDNLANISIGTNSILSQGVYLCTGNHNFKTDTFDLMLGEIKIGNSTWVGAKSVISPNVTICDQVIISLGSVVKKSIDKPGIYGGNPAVFIKENS